MYDLHLAALDILERTGVAVLHGEARNLLSDAGAVVEEQRVRIPSHLVEDAIRSAPKRITVADRSGEKRLFVDMRNVYFSPVVANSRYYDPRNRKIRPFVRRDLPETITVADHLKNMDLQGMGTIVTDLPGRISGRVVFKEILIHSTKPIYFEALNVASLKSCIEMAAVVRGGMDELRKNPYIIHYSEPVSPLNLTEEGVSKILMCADYGIPVIYIPMPMLGQSAPATFAGILAQNIAEVFAGLVIVQLRQRGAAFMFGGIPSMLDMKTALYSYGAAELNLLCAALTEISHYYSLPMFGTAGCSDAKITDEQAAVELSMSILMSALSGANLVHDIGLIGGGLTVSSEAFVLCDEIIQMVDHMLRPIEINMDTLALDLIDQVGPGGSFIETEHTLHHFRQCWYSELFDRGTYNEWEKAGSMTLSDRLNKKVLHILEHYQAEPLLKEMIDELDAIEKSWR
jgi:trimethylamine--corrinoid protein Co-methyltransferase